MMKPSIKLRRSVEITCNVTISDLNADSVTLLMQTANFSDPRVNLQLDLT
jgi:hypothetical protein